MHYDGTNYCTACYYCIVNGSESGIEAVENDNGTIYSNRTARLKAYYTALAREKYDLIKLSDYVNGSATQS